jgi:predicted MPP superfamily phosphohydrolase
MPMAYKVRTNTLPLLPKGASDIKILHFSDLHLTPSRKALIKDIKSWIDLKPDLIISTGDFLGHKEGIKPLINALDKLLDIPGLFVFGSNDYYGPKFKIPFSYLMTDRGERKLGEKLNWRLLQKKLTDRGWKDLNHKKFKIRIKGVVIEARGTDDAHLDLDNYLLVEGKKSKSADISIGVTHAPYERVLAAMAQDKLDLIFAGHTHGGQVRLPWPGGSKALTTNCDLDNWRASGLSKVNDEPWLNVSAGMSFNPFTPVRLFCPPEVTLINLIENQIS